MKTWEKIIYLKNKNYSSKEIAKLLNVRNNFINTWLKKKDKPYKKGRPKDYKCRQTVCDIINRENPIDPLTDKKIEAILKTKGFKIYVSKVCDLRKEMKIPPAYRHETMATRQFIYFTKGRYQWNVNRRHKLIKKI